MRFLLLGFFPPSNTHCLRAATEQGEALGERHLLPRQFGERERERQRERERERERKRADRESTDRLVERQVRDRKRKGKGSNSSSGRKIRVMTPMPENSTVQTDRQLN